MKFGKLLLITLFGLVWAVNAFALSFSDVDVDGQNGEPDWYYLKSSKHHSSAWSSTFDILAAGFDPLTMKIVSATVSFAFADDGDNKYEFAQISVGGIRLWNYQEVDGSHHDAPFSYDWYGMNLGVGLLEDLDDGILEYEVAAKKGDFYLKEASIVAKVERLSVPDTGVTIAMFGIGVASIVVLRRQMKSGEDA